ncbi:MAG TPA: hypothetical protein VMV29_03830 [Ktedonobacterales bacterium]|nr:hypothetical protein [Ktedonobacterales bacterium]
MIPRALRWAERILGALTGVALVVSAIIGANIPVRSVNPAVAYGGVNLFDYLGARLAVGVLLMFLLLAVFFAGTAILHAREGTSGWLAGEWSVGVLLAVAVFATNGFFAYLFYPSLGIAVVSLLVSSLRQLTAATNTPTRR